MPPEPTATPAVDERSVSVLALALWAGIVTGFAELAKLGLDLLHSDFIYRSRDALWMIPAFDAGLFALVGLVLVIVGLLWPRLRELGLGRLPGDIVIERGNVHIYFPIVTCIIVSVVLSIILWLTNR